MTETEEIIHDYLLGEVLQDKQLNELNLTDELLETELLDSIAIMQVVAVCEQVFEIVIPEEELVPENFCTIRAITNMVERRLADSREEH